MSDFKIGDIVKCMDNGSFSLIKKDVNYKITGIKLNVGSKEILLRLQHINGEFVGGDEYWYLDSRFEKVEPCKDNPFDYFCNIQLLHGVKALKLTVCVSGHEIRIFNDLTLEGGKRIELWNVITYHNDKCEIADENMRRAIEYACEIYDMIFKA